jgi:hypothetical protein
VVFVAAFTFSLIIAVRVGQEKQRIDALESQVKELREKLELKEPK